MTSLHDLALRAREDGRWPHADDAVLSLFPDTSREFISAASPDAIIALSEEVEQLKAQGERMKIAGAPIIRAARRLDNIYMREMELLADEYPSDCPDRGVIGEADFTVGDLVDFACAAGVDFDIEEDAAVAEALGKTQ